MSGHPIASALEELSALDSDLRNGARPTDLDRRFTINAQIEEWQDNFPAAARPINVAMKC